MQRITPVLRVARRLRMQAVAWRVEGDRLAHDLLDHRPPSEVIFELTAAVQESAVELEAAELGQRMLIIAPLDVGSILGAAISKEEEEDQSVGLVTRHLQEPGRPDLTAFGVAQVP